MNHTSIAPCGVICDLCYGFQRTKNKCVGCNQSGNKPYHCIVCSIKSCAEKQGNEKLLCSACIKYPCRRIKDLDKRYRLKYGESIIQNLNQIETFGMAQFIEQAKEKWHCNSCGSLLCVHREACLHCGNKNDFFPQN
ncbi:MAG: hypothetical protein CVU09_00885 [Bacteroidetes bacterium HGW-Bacteroidetes-4]|jgi:hypothetical protein|nr:MAG: hypothetical protein CVU09_00885 [Bacteroidetes bacterium HGW-Bacteroidetes-4]